MKVLGIFLFFLFFCLVVAFPSVELNTTPQPFVKDIILTIGADEFANVARDEIIPKLRFLLSTIPDSLWNRFESEYDSAKTFLHISKAFSKHFDPKEAEEYYKLAQKLMKEPIDSSLSKFEHFLDKMDSVEKYIQQVDSMLKYSKKLRFQHLQPNSDYDRYQKYVDSVVKFFKEFKPDSPEILTFDDSLFKKYRFRFPHYPDSLKIEFLHPDTLRFHFKPETLDSILKKSPPLDTNYLKIDIKSSIDLVNVYLQTIQELTKFYLEYIDSLRTFWNKSLKMINKYIEEAQKQKSKVKELKDVEIEFKKYSKEFDQLNKQFIKRYEDLLQGFNKRMKNQSKSSTTPNENIKKLIQEKNLEIQLEKFKQLFKDHKKFLEEMLKLKKQIESDILNELKERGYIVE